MKYINHLRRTAMLLILLLAGWATGCPVSAQTMVDVVPDPSTNLTGTDDGTAVKPIVALDAADYGVTFNFSIGSGTSDPAYYRNGSSIRLYKGNTFTMESSSYVVERVEFQSVAYRSGASTLSVEDDGILVPYDEKTLVYTWENTSRTKKVTFGINDSQLRISSVKLTLVSEGGVTTLAAPVFSQKSCEFYQPFELTVSDINEPSATIYYTMDGSIPTAADGRKYVAPITIPAGNDVTVKAIAVSGNNVSAVTSATYHFIPKHLLSVKMLNKSGINYVYYSSDKEYGEWRDDNSAYITEGEVLYIGYNLNSGYKCKDIKLNGVSQSISNNSFYFEMPANDVELVIDAVFDPSSPADPQPGETSREYNLYLVSNPDGAASLSGAGSYEAGSEVYINAYSRDGYIFTGWTKDGETLNTGDFFRYTMPASDVVLTANYVYNPSSPSDPQQPALKHPLTVIASPAGAGTFSTTGSEVTYGEEYYVYAYPQSGYKFKGWIVNGVAQEGNSTQYRGIMTDVGAQVVGLFIFDPASPSNPGANYYNPTTGQVIIDDFTQGNLYGALRDVTGYDNYGNVSSIIVKGRMSSDDYGALGNLTNTVTIDLSRTGGVTTVPGYAFQNSAAANILLPSTVTNMSNYVFSNCSNLTSLTVYAMEPPVCGPYTFSGFANKDNCTVFVPAASIGLYITADYWKDFTILPITDDAHVLQVNLPADATDGRYKSNSIELVNLNSGVRQKYVISDRLLYTFNGLRKDEQYNVYMLSRAGLELGRIENITVPDADFEVTFDRLKPVYSVNAVVKTPDGEDVTSDVTVEWLKPLADGTTTYLRKATSLGEIPEGQALLCRITLNNQLGTVYAIPEDIEFTVGNEHNTCTVNLVPLRSIVLSGAVADGDGASLAGASVSVSQTLNGKYSKSYTAKTDRQGKWTLAVLDAPETRLTYSAAECVNVNDTIGAIEPAVSSLDLGKITLKSIVGARVTYGFTYHAAGSDDVRDFYSDYQNVLVSVFNVTQNRAHNDVSLQYPILAVLDENINIGDELWLTATSKKAMFNPIVETVTVGDNQRAEVTFDIIGKGGVAASFEMTDNPAVIAMLYSSKGELLKKQTYSEAETTFTELEDGDYTLVSMGQSDLMNSILRLSNFAEIGLTEGKDYVKNAVKVESGKLSEVRNSEIPAFDESLFYYTNSSTSFSSNKSSITTGNYLTLRAAIDFKGVYKNDISNVALVVDLPEACDFVEQSVIQGPNLLPYTLDNNRLTIQLGNAYTAQTRFCVIPTSGGTFNATASIVFDYNGKTLTQPIGSASSEIKDLEITVPKVIAGQRFKVSGTAQAKSAVQVMDYDVVIGECKANSNGSWSCECVLENAENLSEHIISALVKTTNGSILTTEAKSVLYNIDAIDVTDVIMTFYNGWLKQQVTVLFDILNGRTSTSSYMFYTTTPVSFIINFNTDDLTQLKNVVLNVFTDKNTVVKLLPKYDMEKNQWIAVHDFSSNLLPVNVSVDFETDSELRVDETNWNSNINSLSYTREDLVATTSDFEDLQSQFVELADLEAPVEQIDAVLQKMMDDAGINLDLISDNVDDISDDFYSDLELSEQIDVNFLFGDIYSAEVVSLMEGTTISQITDETPAKLLDDGFSAVAITDGNVIYTFDSEDVSIIVDFANNVRITIDLTSQGDIAQMVKLLRASSSTPENEWIEKIQKFSSKLNSLTSAISTAVQSRVDWFSMQKSTAERLLKRAVRNRDNSITVADYRLYQRQVERYTRRVKMNTKIIDFLTKGKVGQCLTGKAAGRIFTIFSIAFSINDWITELRNLQALRDGMNIPCEKAQPFADKIKQDINGWIKGAGVYYVARITLNIAQLGAMQGGLAALIPSAGTSSSAIAVAVGIAAADFAATLIFENKLASAKNNFRTRISNLSKYCDDDDDDDDDNPQNDPNPENRYDPPKPPTTEPTSPIHDPSGFVFEAVPENRVEGVQATIYYKETREDMYGDPYEEVVLWDAEEYAQENPLFTDEFGMYQWDVPQGLWQVKFEKDGYVTAYSEWLPVPPPQLEVNIGIVQNKQPEVTEARAYEEGVEVQFDKFMDLSTLTTDNICVTANGEKLGGSIRLIDSALADEYADEEDEAATRYASRVRFVPEEALSATTGEVRVTVSRNVLSYAGIPMTETYTQVLDVEKEVQVIAADDVKVLYGGEKEVTVYAMPYEAAVGRTLRIANSSDLIMSVDKTEATIDDEGKATVIVKGDLPGRAQLTFSIDDVTVTGECAVDVVTEIINAEAPKASRASGTAVYRGTKVELTTESKDGVIYFTTDGSCPCDENGTRRKYTVPVIINEDTKILAITAVGNGDDDVSETVEFNYTLKRSNMDFAMDEGWSWISHNFETPVAASTLAADENVQRIMSQTHEVIRDPQLGMVGVLQQLNAPESYKVETTSATTRQRLSDVAWNPATPIALNSGWNWLGYPVGQTMSVDEAFAPTAAENLDVIVGQNGFAQFDGENWIGTLEVLSPGLGYMYRSQSPKNVVYNTSIVSTASARYVAGISQNSPLVLDIHKYASIMPVVATVMDIDGMNPDNADYQVNAFCGTECRGIGRVVNGLVMMNVYGNANDIITFLVTDNDGTVQFANNSSLSFSERIVGNLNDPYEISINSRGGVGGVTYDGNIKVSIVGDMLVIKGIAADDIDLVEVYDTDGHKLIHETKVSEQGVRVSQLKTGVYIVIVNGNGEYTYHKTALR